MTAQHHSFQGVELMLQPRCRATSHRPGRSPSVFGRLRFHCIVWRERLSTSALGLRGDEYPGAEAFWRHITAWARGTILKGSAKVSVRDCGSPWAVTARKLDTWKQSGVQPGVSHQTPRLLGSQEAVARSFLPCH